MKNFTTEQFQIFKAYLVRFVTSLAVTVVGAPIGLVVAFATMTQKTSSNVSVAFLTAAVIGALGALYYLVKLFQIIIMVNNDIHAFVTNLTTQFKSMNRRKDVTDDK